MEKDAAFCHACRIFGSAIVDLRTPLHVLNFVIGSMQQANLECCQSMLPLVVVSNQCHGVNIKKNTRKGISIADRIDSSRRILTQTIDIIYLRNVAEVLLVCGRQDLYSSQGAQ